MIKTLAYSPLAALEIAGTVGVGALGALREKVFRSYDYRQWLRRDLADCDTILELGCGSNSPILQIGYGKKTYAVDIFQPYVDMHNRLGNYRECWQADVLKFSLATIKSFDAVVAFDILEHLDRSAVEARGLLEEMEKQARKKVILFTPNGWTANSQVDGNEYQLHRSQWEPADYQGRGYTVTGTHGWRWIIGECGLPRRCPYSVWAIVAMLSLPLMVNHPEWAGHSYAVKNV